MTRAANFDDQTYAVGGDGPHRGALDGAHWSRRLANLAARHSVPGASLGILRLRPGGDDQRVEAACGVTNLDTGVPVTADTLFQIGSITKVWTTTIVMQLVDEGKLDLDAPIVDVLPELRLADPQARRGLTMRHLLTHTSGIDGDIFTDTGRGDDCIARYVDKLGDVGQIHPLGAGWSYCNTGFVIAGRVIETITGGTWDAAIRERIATPLGLEHTVTLPEEALLHRTAVGHVGKPGEEPRRAPAWQLPRSMGPAGLVTCSVGDVLGFARMHVTDGLGPDGARVLSAGAATAMRDRQAELSDPYTLGDSWGLGWSRFTWDGRQVVGHDGNTIGQSAFLRILPEEGLAVALLTNGGHARDLYQDLYREIFGEVADVVMPLPLCPLESGARQPDAARHVGTYERAGIRMEVFRDGGGLKLRMTDTADIKDEETDGPLELDLVPADTTGDLFCVRPVGVQTWTPVTFTSGPDGTSFLHNGGRALPRVDRPTPAEGPVARDDRA